MNKIAIIVGVLLIAGGYFAGEKAGSEKVPVINLEQHAGVEFKSPAEGEATMTGSVQRTQGTIIVVNAGESIQAAVQRAVPGDTIRVMPGTYKETIYIDKDDIALSGVVVKGEWPILEGEHLRNDAILYSGNGVIVENFWITHYKGNGIMGQAGNNYIIRNNVVVDTGVYGIFPQYGKNGLIEHNVLSGIEDAAIYVGMCDNVDVRHNEVFDSVAGIEIENSRHAIVEYNYVHDNTGGILAFITPGLPIKTSEDIIIRGNFVVNNNTPNFGAPGSIVAGIPKGTGILIMAADDVVIENNIITGHDGIPITITDFTLARSANDPDSEPNPNRVVILDNIIFNNGLDPDPMVRSALLANMTTSVPDIVDTVGMDDGCVLHPERYTTLGLEKYGVCEISTTENITTYTLAEPVPARSMDEIDLGKTVYYAVCAGCHSYSARMVGPPTLVIQALYLDNPEGIFDYISAPTKKRDDYPEMPPQSYLSDEKRMAAAEYMLKVKK
ncbi:MAG: parallel beta-helix repeat protein [Halieaceae bacterium]